MKTKNRGFSLAEILIAIAVMAIVGSLVGGFLIFSTNTYGRAASEASMQESAQIVLSQVNNYIIDSDATMKYFVDVNESGSGVEVLKDDLYSGNAADLQMKRLEIYKQVAQGTSVEKLVWKKSLRTITYEQEIRDDSGTVVSQVLAQKLASDITEFAVDLTEMSADRRVTSSLAVAYEGRNYAAESVVNLRNQLVSPTDLTTVTVVPTNPTVLSVRIVPATAELRPGTYKSFQAVVYGTDNPSQEVTWSWGDEAPRSALTTIVNGRLWVASDESASSFTIRATSVQDNTKYAEATVNVLLPTKLSLGSIRDYWTFTNYSTFMYVRVNGNLESDLEWTVTPKNSQTTMNNTTVTEIKALHALRFVSGNVGEYTVTIRGQVDGRVYTDTATIHVDSYDTMTREVENYAGIRFVGNNRLDYWVQAGDTVYLDTELYNFTRGSEYETRSWTHESTDGIPYTFRSEGEYQKSAVVTVGETMRTGEIFVNAIIKYDNQLDEQDPDYRCWDRYYDTVVIHVYEPLDFPYIIETVNLEFGDNFAKQRSTYRGPVKVASSTSELTNLAGGINSLLQRGYTLVDDTNKVGSGGNPANFRLEDTYFKVPGNPYLMVSEQSITVAGVLVTENNLKLDSAKIESDGDAVIWVKGDHELQLSWEDCYFDGIIYAPEGTVRIKCKTGFFRGIIIAKNAELSEVRGDGHFSYMEKQSVMDLANMLKN